jgi:hypothetical protein
MREEKKVPYIDAVARGRLDPLVDHLRTSIGEYCTPGDLNYMFTQIALAYLKVKGTRYAQINDVVGALESAKLEFYRRLAGPYEDSKIAQNGDVFPLKVAA